MPASARPVPAEVDLALRRQQADAFLSFSRITRQVERRVAELLHAHGLADVTPAQANVLMVLFQARAPLTARHVADAMSLSQPTIGRFIHALEREGWVERRPDPADSRAMLLRPTKKAFAALPRFIAVSNALLDEAFAGCGPATVRRIGRTLERILGNLSASRGDGEGPGDDGCGPGARRL
jgi:DNA-binding MarR family transcriptional regulator